MDIKKIFSQKQTENGDMSYDTTGDNMLDILFMTEYYQHHLNEIKLGSTDKDKLFAMFMRDPRFGMGRRDLGRVLMQMAKVDFDNIVKAGRFDDLFLNWETMSAEDFSTLCSYLLNEIKQGNELCKKWMPRYSSKNLMLARKIAKEWGMTKQQYGHFIKCNSVENQLSRKDTEDIVFEHVPSLALLKYWNRFRTGDDTASRFQDYLDNVRVGKTKVNISTTNVYDIYRNRYKIDADLMFEQLEKIKINCMVILDSSGSMQDANDSYGKARAIGHYLSKCSTFMPNYIISFSSNPQLMQLTSANSYSFKDYYYLSDQYDMKTCDLTREGSSNYCREIASMYTGDCSNTDFAKVCDLLKQLDKDSAPEYLVVLSDMEFDAGSRQSASDLQSLFIANGFNTNLIWWNFNSRNKTVTFQHDEFGNIYLSGYSPVLLKYLEVGFDSKQFLDKLLSEYSTKIQ